MCLKHTTDRELLEEVKQRISEKSIDWGITYLYNEDKTQFKLTCKNDNDWTFTFTQPTDIEKGFIIRQAYKNYQVPILEQKATAEHKKQMEELLKSFNNSKK